MIVRFKTSIKWMIYTNQLNITKSIVSTANTYRRKKKKKLTDVCAVGLIDMYMYIHIYGRFHSKKLYHFLHDDVIKELAFVKVIWQKTENKTLRWKVILKTQEEKYINSDKELKQYSHHKRVWPKQSKILKLFKTLPCLLILK